MLIDITAVALWVLSAVAVPQSPAAAALRQPESEEIPAALALQDISSAYASAPTAEIVTVRATLRTVDRSESLTQSYVVRIDPDPQSGTIRQLLLELGPLRAWFGDGQLLVTSTSSSDKFYRASYLPPLSAATVEALLPPIPAPQIALATGADSPLNLTPYSPGVVFANALAYTRARPQVMTLSGAGPAGPVTLTADVQSARILRFTCEAATPQPSLIELTCRTLDPGDPSTWKPQVEGRQRVASLAELRPSPPVPLKVGDRIQELSLSRPELAVWSLRQALGGPPPRNVAVVLWRWSTSPEQARLAARDAASGLRALQSFDTESPGDDLLLVPAVVIELSEYSGAALESAAGAWAAARPQGSEDRTLLWSNSAARSIELFAAGSNAAAVVIAPDRVIRAIVPLDGAAESSDMLERFRAALAPKSVPTAPAEPAAPATGERP